jgi:ABC-type sugar transport system substrate-binding protein
MKILAVVLVCLALNSAPAVLAHRGESRGFSSIFGQVQRVGDQWVQTVKESVQEAGNVAKILAGDAKDALKTVQN